MAAAAWEAVADAAGVGDRTSLLDLGCGDGAFCALAARRGASVHGLDAEPDAIAQARDAVPGGDFRLGLMESLPWAEDSFDVVTAFDAVQYALDTEMALIEASRVLRADGRIAVSKWGPPATNEFFAFLTSIGARGVRGGQLPVTDPVEVAIRSTGVAVLATGELPAPIEIAGDAALESSLSRAGVDAGPDAIAAAARWRHADGTYRFDNRQRYWILGRRS
ncbi:MAG: class I SAM-dependent methyltransferase [Solirubrobacteraceae bacterium]